MIHFILCVGAQHGRNIYKPNHTLFHRVPSVNGRGWDVYPSDEVDQALVTIQEGLRRDGKEIPREVWDLNRDEWFPMSMVPLDASQECVEKYQEYCPVWAEGRLIALLLRKST